MYSTSSSFRGVPFAHIDRYLFDHPELIADGEWKKSGDCKRFVGKLHVLEDRPAKDIGDTYLTPNGFLSEYGRNGCISAIDYISRKRGYNDRKQTCEYLLFHMGCLSENKAQIKPKNDHRPTIAQPSVNTTHATPATAEPLYLDEICNDRAFNSCMSVFTLGKRGDYSALPPLFGYINQLLIARGLMDKSINKTDESEESETISEMLKSLLRYNVGVEGDYVVWWYIDQFDMWCEGKMMLYGADGHRVKDKKNTIHTVYKQAFHQLYNHDPEIKPRKPLFGEHLLRANGITVRVVESEKTAVICDIIHRTLNPSSRCVYVATGGKSNLNLDTLKFLVGHVVEFYPDLDAEEEWKTRLQQLYKDPKTYRPRKMCLCRLSQMGLNLPEKADLADVLAMTQTIKANGK